MIHIALLLASVESVYYYTQMQKNIYQYLVFTAQVCKSAWFLLNVVQWDIVKIPIEMLD